MNTEMQKQKNLNKAEIVFRLKTFIIVELPIHILIMSNVFMWAIILNKYIEAISYLIAYFVLRYKFDVTYHHRSPVVCILLTISMFVLSVIFVEPLYMSLFSSIIFAFLCSMILYLIQYILDLKEQNEITLFDLSKDELYKVIDNYILKTEERYAIEFYVINGLKGEEFYNAMGYSKRQCLSIYKSAVKKSK